MLENDDQVTVAALALPAPSRARLVDRLLTSLDPPAQGQTDELWGAEAEDRISEFERGEMRTIPGNEVLKALRARNDE